MRRKVLFVLFTLAVPVAFFVYPPFYDGAPLAEMWHRDPMLTCMRMVGSGLLSMSMYAAAIFGLRILGEPGVMQSRLTVPDVRLAFAAAFFFGAVLHLGSIFVLWRPIFYLLEGMRVLTGLVFATAVVLLWRRRATITGVVRAVAKGEGRK